MPDTQDIRTAEDADLGVASEYDAFISYKHGPVDSAAAKALQKNLEHFHVPIIAGKTAGEAGRKRIRRVFLDEGELSATPAFASRIRQALKNSRWLIIICSPATKDSPWVDLEIRTFLEFHDRDHILAVMTSGEPADIFPEAFAGSGNLPDEMLAADARGVTVYEVIRKLRGDTLLRIAAPILGLTYDDLRQRHRVYRLQRFLLAASVFIVAITGFLVYASVQNRKLSQFNRDLRLRQAELITAESSAELEDGNITEAIRGLLQAVTDLSEDTSSRSTILDSVFGTKSTSEDILPSSQYELTRALNLYVPYLAPNFEDQHIAPSAVLESGETLFPDLISDSSGTHLLAAGQKRVYVWDTATEQLCSEISFDDYIVNWSQEALLDGDRIILCGAHNAVCYNYLTGKADWKTTVLNEVRAVTRSGSSSAVDRLYLVSDFGITVLDADSGALVTEYSFVSGRDEEIITSYSFNSGGGDNGESPLFGTIMESSVSENGKYLLFTSREEYKQASLYVHDLENGKTVKLETVPYYDECFNAVSYCTEEAPDTEHVLYSRFINKENGYATVLTSVALEYEVSSLTFVQEWEREVPLTQQTRSSLAEGRLLAAYNLLINILPRPRSENAPASIMFACDDELLLVNPENGEIMSDYPLPGKIIKLMDSPEHCFLCLRSGRIYDFTGKELKLYTTAFADNLYDIEKLGDRPSFYCLGRNNRITHYSSAEPDLAFVKLASHESVMPSRVLCQDGDLTLLGENINLCLISEKEDTARVITYAELLQSAHREKDGNAGNGTESANKTDSSGVKVLGAQDGIIHLIKVSNDSSQDSVLTHYQLRAADGTVTAEDLLRINDSFYLSDNVLYDPGRQILYIMSSKDDVTVIWAYSFDSLKAVRHVLPLGSGYSFYCLSPEGDKILLYSDSMDLLVLNANTWQTEYTISGSAYAEAAVKNLKYSYDHTRICWDGHTLVVPDRHKLHVYDDTGRETNSISCEYGTDNDLSIGIPCAALSPGGSCLYFLQNSTLVQYSLIDNKVLNEITLPANPAAAFLSSDVSWTVCFDPVHVRTLDRLRIDFPIPGSDVQEPDTMHIVYNGIYYCVRCDSDAFGVMTQVNGAAAYNPASGRIYLDSYNANTSMHDYLYYKEYSIRDIIDIARERYSGL